MTPTDQADGARPRRRRATAVGILGEIFVTFGIFVLLFLGWQLWFNPAVSTVQQTTTANSLSTEWAHGGSAPANSDNTPADPQGNTDPVVRKEPASHATFANLIVPRFGPDFTRPVSQGIDYPVLNNSARGLGHYPGTQMPGGVGNFALASHRTAFGGAFHDLNTLRVGDHIYVETKDGWYRYVFRDLQYVRSTGIGVILPVPDKPAATPVDRVITLTTCNPVLSTAERIIAYGVFDRYFPRAGGAPLEIVGVAGKVS